MVLTDHFIPLLWTSIFLIIWSVFYRENRAYRVIEALTIGLNIGLFGYYAVEFFPFYLKSSNLQTSH